MKTVSMTPVPKDDRKLALVIIDVQKAFFMKGDEKTVESARIHTPLMTKVVDMFREAGRPVIWVIYEGVMHAEGITDDPSILLDGFEIKEGDMVVKKYHMNAFNNTNLSDVIQSNDCDAALFMGMFAQYCVMSSYWGAVDKGVASYMMEGGLISTDEKYCDIAMELCKHYTIEELESNLKKNKVE